MWKTYQCYSASSLSSLILLLYQHSAIRAVYCLNYKVQEKEKQSNMIYSKFPYYNADISS